MQASDCAGAVTSSVPWLSASLAGGGLTVSAGVNTGVGSRYGKVTVGGTSVIVTQFGTSAPSATASVAGSPRSILLSEGVPGRTADVIVTVRPPLLPSSAKADVVATFNGYFANDVPAGQEGYATLLTNVPGVAAFNPYAVEVDRNTLKWPNVPIGALQQAAPNGVLTLRLTRLRVVGATQVSVELTTTAALSFNNGSMPLTIAQLNASAITRTIGSPTPGPIRGSVLVPITFTETVPTAFSARDGNTPGTRFIISDYSGFEAYPAVFSASGNAQLIGATYSSSVGYGIGGSYLTGSRSFGGGAYDDFANAEFGVDRVATWELKTASDSALESVTLNVIVLGSDGQTFPECSDSNSFGCFLSRVGPKLFFKSNPCGNPRPLSSSKEVQRSAVNECGTQTAEVDVRVDSVTVVSGNQRVSYIARNTSEPDPNGVEPPAPVTIRGNAPAGYAYASCVRDDGSDCGNVAAGEFEQNIDLQPGTSTRYTVLLAPVAPIEEGTPLETRLTAVSRSDEQNQSNNESIVGFVHQSCSPMSPASGLFTAAPGTGVVNVPNCYIWTASSATPWIAIASPVGEAFEPGEVRYNVAANPGSTSRTGEIVIAGRSYPVTQRGRCSFAVSPGSIQASAAGTVVPIQVSTGPDCNWLLTGPAWVSAPGGGKGTQTVNVNVTQNHTFLSRSGSLTISETGVNGGPTATVSVSQAAAPCTATLSPTTATASAAGGTGTFAVTVTGGSCPWTLSDDAAWLQLSASSGSASSQVVWTAGANSGATRSALISLFLAGQTSPVSTLRVTQAPPVGIAADFDRNGTADLLWRSDSQPIYTVWFFGGPQGTDRLDFGFINGPELGWRLVTSADFNGDGRPDLVWQNEATRQATVWYMGGPKGNQFVGFNLLSPSMPGWRIVAANDLNRDGSPDLVWQRDSTREVNVWYMGGAQGNALLSFHPLPSPLAGWRLASAADFDANGYPDLVWQHDTNGQATVWYLGGAQGRTYTGFSFLGPPAPGWRIISAADVDRDGKPDLTWQNDSTRRTTVWFFGGSGGASFLGWQFLSGPVPGWRATR